MPRNSCKLISYIAPGAPATRRPATGDEPFLRPEIGFTPRWYHQSLGINFGEPWHTDPAYRYDTIVAMRTELRQRFPNTTIGRINEPVESLDILTGTFGACTVAGVYGVPIIYSKDKWPACEQCYLTAEKIEQLEPPNLNRNPFFQQLMSQVEWIAEHEERIEGFINWQGVLNNAHRLRGQDLFIDMIESPDRALHLFNCICITMIEAAKYLHERQLESGVTVKFFTVSNCLVNMISPQLYSDLLLPFDLRIAEAFGCIGIHNCAWNANPYLEAYAQVPDVGYIDMGLESDLRRARTLFSNARRAIMYTPMELAQKSLPEIRADLERIAHDYGPCDIVAADIEVDTPDERVLHFIRICEEISRSGIEFQSDRGHRELKSLIALDF